ncbi:unannotated protein [freshwater metagenome]|uniref:Unannotated protein n=1 Tax=freshwater metagenome TaxID=449393 RepID=A0A6J6D2C8_9ZZZZ
MTASPPRSAEVCGSQRTIFVELRGEEIVSNPRSAGAEGFAVKMRPLIAEASPIFVVLPRFVIALTLKKF